MSELTTELDALRVAAGRTEAFAAVAVQLYDDGADADPAQAERVAYLLGAAAEAAAVVVAAVERFRVLVADQQPAEAGDEWEREGGDERPTK